jgi:hypothetical protein
MLFDLRLSRPPKNSLTFGYRVHVKARWLSVIARRDIRGCRGCWLAGADVAAVAAGVVVSVVAFSNVRDWMTVRRTARYLCAVSQDTNAHPAAVDISWYGHAAEPAALAWAASIAPVDLRTFSPLLPDQCKSLFTRTTVSRLRTLAVDVHEACPLDELLPAAGVARLGLTVRWNTPQTMGPDCWRALASFTALERLAAIYDEPRGGRKIVHDLLKTVAQSASLLALDIMSRSMTLTHLHSIPRLSQSTRLTSLSFSVNFEKTARPDCDYWRPLSALVALSHLAIQDRAIRRCGFRSGARALSMTLSTLSSLTALDLCYHASYDYSRGLDFHRDVPLLPPLLRSLDVAGPNDRALRSAPHRLAAKSVARILLNRSSLTHLSFPLRLTGEGLAELLVALPALRSLSDVTLDPPCCSIAISPTPCLTNIRVVCMSPDTVDTLWWLLSALPDLREVKFAMAHHRESGVASPPPPPFLEHHSLESLCLLWRRDYDPATYHSDAGLIRERLHAPAL